MIGSQGVKRRPERSPLPCNIQERCDLGSARNSISYFGPRLECAGARHQRKTGGGRVGGGRKRHANRRCSLSSFSGGAGKVIIVFSKPSAGNGEPPDVSWSCIACPLASASTAEPRFLALRGLRIPVNSGGTEPRHKWMRSLGRPWRVFTRSGRANIACRSLNYWKKESA
jgi:hypothetical protein